MSGKKRLISIIKPAVKVIQIVKRTGAVDKYFWKSSIKRKVIINNVNNSKNYLGETVTSLSVATKSPLTNSCHAEIGQM